MIVTAKKDAQIDKRLADVAKEYLKNGGTTQQMLADKWGVSRTTITKDVTTLKKRWRATQREKTEEHVSIQLAQLNERKKEALNWLEHFGIIEFDGDDEQNDRSINLHEDRLNSAQAIKWFEAYLKVLDQEAKLLGLYKPEKVEVNAKLDAKLSGKLEVKRMSDEELQQEIDNELRKRGIK
jgi:DNA-binding transcriptional MocR family regulator